MSQATLDGKAVAPGMSKQLCAAGKTSASRPAPALPSSRPRLPCFPVLLTRSYLGVFGALNRECQPSRV